MRVMAGGAISLFNRVIRMQLFKRGLVRFMTFQTKGRRFVGEQLHLFLRGMGIMAYEAVLFNRRVLELVSGNFISQVLMTFETELAARQNKVVFIVRRMGIMAQNAFPLHHHLVGAHGPLRGQVVMTGVAYIGGIGDQESLMVRSVRTMAAGALALGKRGVDKFFLQLLLEGDMTGQTDFTPGPGFKVELSLGK